MRADSPHGCDQYRCQHGRPRSSPAPAAGIARIHALLRANRWARRAPNLRGPYCCSAARPRSAG